jgi:hypothetical protein
MESGLVGAFGVPYGWLTGASTDGSTCLAEFGHRGSRAGQHQKDSYADPVVRLLR